MNSVSANKTYAPLDQKTESTLIPFLDFLINHDHSTMVRERFGSVKRHWDTMVKKNKQYNAT